MKHDNLEQVVDNKSKRDMRRGVVAVVAATALSVSGIAFTAPLAFADPETGFCNPMGGSVPVEGGSAYTIYTTGDTVLNNSELEGTVAVGGAFTAGNGNNDYPLLHTTGAGNANYELPVIDSAPNRVLANTIGGSTTRVIKVEKNRSGNKGGLAKIVNTATPSGWSIRGMNGHAAFMPTSGNNQSPQLISELQQWINNAADPAMKTESNSFSSYFNADNGSAILGHEDNFVAPVSITGDSNEMRITLTPGKPNRIDLSQISGTNKVLLINYGPTNPLIVKVPAGSSAVLPEYMTEGRANNGDNGNNYILWDMSDSTGDVTVSSRAGWNIRGSIYAPNANITLPPGTQNFEGQVIAAKFTANTGGQEIHTNLFQGLLPCDETPTEPTETPTGPTETPTGPTETPTEPSETPTGPTETPTEPSDGPTEPGETPTGPTETPTGPTETPTEPSDGPTEPGETPTETGSTTEPAVPPTETSGGENPGTTPGSSDAPTDPENQEETGVLAQTGAQQTFLALALGALMLAIGTLIVRSSRKQRKH